MHSPGQFEALRGNLILDSSLQQCACRLTSSVPLVTAQCFPAVQSCERSSPHAAFRWQMDAVDFWGKMLPPKCHCLWILSTSMFWPWNRARKFMEHKVAFLPSILCKAHLTMFISYNLVWILLLVPLSLGFCNCTWTWATFCLSRLLLFNLSV